MTVEPSEKIQEIHARLDRYNREYYAGTPSVPDAVFDGLMKELVQLESEFPALKDPNSPSARVGSDLSNDFEKHRHSKRMLSLDNAFSLEQIQTKLSGLTDFVVEPKIDGMSLELCYVDGHLIRAVTRGDGVTGDIVTANARTIKNIPLVLPEKLSFSVRGEVYIPKSVFEKLNAGLDPEDRFANPRNCAAGSMKSKASSAAAKRGLHFIAYHLVDALSLGVDFQSRVYSWLLSLGFHTPFSCGPNQQSAVKYYQNIQDIGLDRPEYDFEIDGLVVKVNDLRVQQELGEGSRSPNWAVAYKFPSRAVTTRLRAIKYTVGRTGQITPNAVLDPVNIDGATVRAASLCNADEIERLQINIGDDVEVIKAGEVIPKVIGVAKKNTEGFHAFITECPCCGTALERADTAVHAYCPNVKCEDRVIQQLAHTVGKTCLDWDGLGESTVRLLVNAGFSSLVDLLKVDSCQLASVLKPAALKKFISQREEIKSRPLWRKIVSLGISGIGKTASQDLCARWNDLAQMENPQEVKRIVGEVAGTNFLNFLESSADYLVQLETLGFYFIEDEATSSGKLSGKTFVITGALVSGTRDQVQARIEAAGGTCKSSVSKKVNYLLIGEMPGGTKTAAAKKHGTAIINEQQLYEMLGEEMPQIDFEIEREF